METTLLFKSSSAEKTELLDSSGIKHGCLHESSANTHAPSHHRAKLSVLSVDAARQSSTVLLARTVDLDMPNELNVALNTMFYLEYLAAFVFVDADLFDIISQTGGLTCISWSSSDGSRASFLSINSQTNGSLTIIHLAEAFIQSEG